MSSELIRRVWFTAVTFDENPKGTSEWETEDGRKNGKVVVY